MESSGDKCGDKFGDNFVSSANPSRAEVPSGVPPCHDAKRLKTGKGEMVEIDVASSPRSQSPLSRAPNNNMDPTKIPAPNPTPSIFTATPPNHLPETVPAPLCFAMVQNKLPPATVNDLELIRLITLKNIFSRQLPKMPREYITRLVMDPKHRSLALMTCKSPAALALHAAKGLKHIPDITGLGEEAVQGCQIIGGICYRTYPEQRFAEIAFCAISATQQVRGFGSVLMNLCKAQGAREGVEYFITYADNYAVGYFKKLGFSKAISMPRGRYYGLIKDYDGGTMMECHLQDNVPYSSARAVVKIQEEYVTARLCETANSHRVYHWDGEDAEGAVGGEAKVEGEEQETEEARRAALASRYYAIPGIKESGWTLEDMSSNAAPKKPINIRVALLQILRKVKDQPWSWPYVAPVSREDAPAYYDIIKDPVDLLTMEQRVKKGGHYHSKQDLKKDLCLMAANCKEFNPWVEGQGSNNSYWDTAVAVEAFVAANEFLFIDDE